MNSTYAQKSSTVQKAADTKAASVLDSSAQGESLQRKADMANNAAQRAEAPRPNNTGMPDNLKAGIESLSGFSMDNVRVHYNSSKPATVQALAYTQGTDIHVAPGQEKCLPHEAWHVAQQMAGRVSPTTNINGMPVNDNAALEHEADVMGEKAVQCKKNRNFFPRNNFLHFVSQRTINCKQEKFLEMVKQYKEFPKGRVYDEKIKKLWSSLKKSPANFEYEDVIPQLAGLDFDVDEFIQRILRSHERAFIDESILAAGRGHGGSKHYDLSRKQSVDRLKKEERIPSETSVMACDEISDFYSYIHSTLMKNFFDLVIPDLYDKIELLKSGRLVLPCDYLLSKSFDLYSLTSRIYINSTSNPLVVHFSFADISLESDREYAVMNTEKQIHETYKKNKHERYVSVVKKEKIHMYWGGKSKRRMKVAFEFDCDVYNDDVYALLENNYRSGVTLY